jgi:hypothetical protein
MNINLCKSGREPELGLSIGWIRGPIIKYRSLSLVRDEMYTFRLRFSIPLMKLIMSDYTIKNYRNSEVESFLFERDLSLIDSTAAKDLGVYEHVLTVQEVSENKVKAHVYDASKSMEENISMLVGKSEGDTDKQH